MKLQSKTLLALAVSGLMAGSALTNSSLAFAGDDTSAEHAEKDSCKGKEGCNGKNHDEDHGDKNSCSSKEDHDKNSCQGKDGCNSK